MKKIWKKFEKKFEKNLKKKFEKNLKIKFEKKIEENQIFFENKLKKNWKN